MMKINLKRVNDAFEMIGTNDNGNTVELDAAASIGGGDSAFRPMQLLLVSLASCSAFDVLNILYKQKQVVKSFEVEVQGDRQAEPPTTFKNIEVTMKLSGQIDPKKLERAISLTKEKYCSVYHMIKDSASIHYSYVIL